MWSVQERQRLRVAPSARQLHCAISCAIVELTMFELLNLDRTNSHSIHRDNKSRATMSTQEPEDLWLFGYG